ncbi:hypothetical protein [Neorhizobium sp. DT-125]|uniref:hypothetical protein n=1 Tax=Neorhizobium sp. DT-125 TaxID=3396163 RepID=UPI003F1E3AF0
MDDDSLPMKIILQRPATDRLLTVLPKLEANDEKLGEKLKKVSNRFSEWNGKSLNDIHNL